MKKHIPIFLPALLTLICIASYGQSSNDIKNYSAKGIYIILMDTSGREVNRLPLGKDVWISYDTFFKSYVILYTDENANTSSLKLKYVMDVTLKEKYTTVKMIDDKNNIFYVVDLLSELGKLKILDARDHGNVSAWMIVDNAVAKPTKQQ